MNSDNCGFEEYNDKSLRDEPDSAVMKMSFLTANTAEEKTEEELAALEAAMLKHVEESKNGQEQ